VVHHDPTGALRRFDGRTGGDTVLGRAARPAVSSAASPDGSRLALGHADSDSARVLMVDLETGDARQAHAAGKAYRQSLAWSPDGSAVAVGYYTERRAGRVTLPDRGDIVVVPVQGTPRRVGCSASKIVLRWLPGSRLIVGDGRNWYVVRASDCRTLSTIRAEGRRALSFSPDGARLAYLTTVQARRGRRSVAVTELRVARGDGTGDEVVLGGSYDPQRPRWSADGTRLLFDVASQDTAGVRHIGLFDTGARRVQFFATRLPEGLPSDTDAHWAPRESRVVHDRTLNGARQKILRTLPTEPGGVQVQPTVLLEGEIGTTGGWLDASHVLVYGEGWAKVVNVESAVAMDLVVPGVVLHVWLAR
jgi:dipeptidyl aminopeptidase/acylaminoacyl peptidase